MTRVGVVVPCKNEANVLRRCLMSLRAQRQPLVKVVVMDNGSSDGSQQIAAELADEVVELPGVTVSALRNQGVAFLGDVDVIGFVDADCEVNPRWLETGLQALREVDMVGARLHAAADASWVARRWAWVEQARAHENSLLWSGHLLVRRATFQSLGGFDESLRTGEDSDLTLRLRASGGRARLLDDMPVTHHGYPQTWRGFVRRESWHTADPGWFSPMAPKSKGLVLLAAGFGLMGVTAAAAAAAQRSWRPLAGWALVGMTAVPTLGWVAGGSLRHCVPDGILVSTWALVRARRLYREPAPRRAASRSQ